ncbi:MFS transporter [Erythrobacter sp. BLCC-B19]|uniref:MFS transporter n=1 Tax=Erythrobacter sp. BLCC-B19 TaxID=3025315 RepID=UPI0023605F02|nr:MFS transporter [Erythrobacter sp. BLCC-B19]WDA41977.1 MFS transporter [Erythrobacter sp. BLCC-B19]
MGDTQAVASALDKRAQTAMLGLMRAFHLILANALVQNLVNLTVWFALIFWAFLETRSVFVTGVIGGIYLVLGASLAIWFGSLVDHHRKQRVMLASSAGSFVLYAAALAWLLAVPEAALTRQDSAVLWGFMTVVMIGVIIGNLRLIALPTLVTALIAPEERDKANGKVGMVSGIGFLLTSGISGFLVAWDGMRGTLVLALAGTALAFAHLLTLRLDEPAPQRAATGEPGRIDLAGTLAVIAAVPGLGALIVFACLNNLLGGVFMALMDGYGLSLMSVEAWGLLWAAASTAFIAAGLIIARMGLGANPLRTLMLVNVVVWLVAALFAIQSSIVLLALGSTLWLLLSPFAEAAEQTTLQQVVPFERQGRVFGFAQSVEQSAAPLTAFLIGPLTQFWAIPFMSDGAGADWIGSWFGTGPERGMALIFVATGVLGMVLTAAAWSSPAYRKLCAALAQAQADRTQAPPA